MNQSGMVKRGGWVAAIVAMLVAAPTLVAQQKMEVRKGGASVKGQAKVADTKSAGSNAGPQIKAVDPVHDFGEIWKGDNIEHTFTIENTGTEILKITKVKPSCGCTLAGAYDKEIPPGGKGKIPIRISTKKLRAKINKNVNVESNDSANPKLRLSVKGQIKERFVIDPPNAGSFGRVQAGAKVERILTLTNNMDTPVKLSLPKNPAKEGPFVGELVEKEPGQVYTLTLKGEGPWQEKVNRANFRISTDMKEAPIIDVSASAYLPPRLEVNPPEIIIPKAVDRERTQRVSVRFNTVEPFKVTGATIDDPNVKVSVSDNNRGQFYVSMDLPANYLPPANGRMLKIQTDDPKNKELKVKVAQRRAAAKSKPQRPAMQLSGKKAPDATFVMASDESKKVSVNDGKPKFLFFYASWCGFCKRSLPAVDKIYQEMSDQNIMFAAVNQDSLKEEGATGGRARTKKQVTDQWTDLKVTFPQLFDPEKSGRGKFKVSSFPTMFLINKDGKVERVYVGAGAVNDGSLKKDIADVVAGKSLKPQEVAAAPTQKPRQRPVMELVGKPAPAATFQLADGGTMSTKDTGNVTLQMYYASWCGFCKKSLPGLSTIYNDMKDKGVNFVGISQDSLKEDGATGRRAKAKADVIKQWSDLKASFPQAFDPEKAGKQKFKVSGFPTMVLIDKDGKVAKAYVGAGSVNDGSLKKDIQKLLDGKSL